MRFFSKRTLCASALTLGMATFGLSACSDSETPGATGTAGTHGTQSGHGTHGGHGGHGNDPNSSDCKGAAPFAPGIMATGTTHKLTVINSDPTSPVVNHDNAWVVQLNKLDGTPVTGARFSKFSPQMPHHGHGLPAEGRIQILETAQNGPGTYRVTNLAFNMAGYWKTDIIVEGTNPDNTAWTDTFVIETCIGK